MVVDWHKVILDAESSNTAWAEIFTFLLSMAQKSASPVALHDATVVPDRLLSDAAWELWEAFPEHAVRTSAQLITWTGGIKLKAGGRHQKEEKNTEIQSSYSPTLPPSSPKAVLILDALSLRELPFLLGGAQARGIQPIEIKVTGAGSPSTTDQFARELGLASRSALANNGKPGTFLLFGGDCYTDVISLPFDDCAVPPTPNIVIWHSWFDDLIHLQHKLPDQITNIASTVLQRDGFWGFVNKLRQGRSLVITSDHGYAVSKRFSSEVEDPEAVEILRNTFGASRNKHEIEPMKKRFMPPIVMSHNGQNMVMGQRKWKVQGGFPHVCHGGMSLLEVAVPWIEFESL